MNRRQERTLGVFHGVLKQIERWPVQERPPLLVQNRTELQGCVARLGELGSEQFRAREAIRGNVDGKVEELRIKRMMPLSRIARPLFAFAPGAEQALKVP